MKRVLWVFLGFTLGVWAHDEFMQWAEQGLHLGEDALGKGLA